MENRKFRYQNLVYKNQIVFEIMRINVYQLNSELYKVTGIQRVLLDIHEAIKDDFNSKIVGTIPYEQVNENLAIAKNDYFKLCNPMSLRNSVVIIHERRLLPLMWIMTHIPGMNIKCVYVHHNELYGKRCPFLFPKNIVAISDSGIKNLTEYFGVPIKNITKIHNCVRQPQNLKLDKKKFDPDNITILYPARINSVKRQLEIVDRLKNKLDHRIKILFAGIGPQYEMLKEKCMGSEQFIALGFRDDILELMKRTDFILLFSTHEGLPITLIEATMLGIPAICNSVGGNSEIIDDGKNGIIANDWDSLTGVLNSIPIWRQSDIDNMSQYSQESYQRKFKFEIFRERYINFLKSVK